MEITDDKSYTIKGALRFSLFSIIGICIFFVKFPFSAGSFATPFDFLITLLNGVLSPYYSWICFLGALIMAYMVIKRKMWTYRGTKLLLNLLAFLGIILIFMDIFKIMPSVIANSGVYKTSTFGKAWLQMLICVIILPLITDYGLPEAIGVILRPVTKALFRLPGKVAIVITSAFVGSYFVGITQANEMYETGKLNNREAIVIATGFSTASLPYIFFMAGLGGITDMFGLLVLVTFVALMIVNVITCRIYPLSKVDESYYPEAEPELEEDYKGKKNILAEAFSTGAHIAERGEPIGSRMGKMFISGLSMCSNVVCCGIAAVVVFGLINLYTPIFTWIGYIFLPILQLFKMPDAGIIASNTALCMISNMAGPMNMSSPSLALSTRFFGASIMGPLVVFMTDFYACLAATKLNVKIGHMFLIWLERAILSVILICIACRLFCF